LKKVRWKSIITGKKKTLVGVMHATREPWLSIASHGQLKHWQLQNYKNFEVVYFFSNTSKIATYLNSVVENLRWKKGRNASYFISYVLMYLFAPFRIFIPKEKRVRSNIQDIYYDIIDEVYQEIDDFEFRMSGNLK
jgi:hypothetical protein